MTESLEQLRERLLREENVQQMIRVRAYEIYEMRGVQAGGPAQDWFEAESEVLAFLLAHESRAVANSEGDRQATSLREALEPVLPPKKSAPRSGKKATAAKNATPAKSPAKRAPSKKSAEPKPRPKRTRKGLKTDENTSG